MSAPRRPAMLNQREGVGWGQILLSVLCVLIVVFSLGQYALNKRCFGVVIVGSSMQETLQDGDFVYAYRSFEERRGDIIVVDMSEDGSTLYIKRLIGVAGDTLYCKNGVVYRKNAGEADFIPLDEGYVNGTTSDFEQVIVGEGQIFMMGDNRGVSHDSRAEAVGCRPSEDIVGVVPEWAVNAKEFTTKWESARIKVVTKIKQFNK